MKRTTIHMETTSEKGKDDSFFIDKTINKGLTIKTIDPSDMYEKYKKEQFLDIRIEENISYLLIENTIKLITNTLLRLRKQLDSKSMDYFDTQLIDIIDNSKRNTFQNLLFIFFKAFDSYKLYNLYEDEIVIKDLFKARKLIAQSVQNEETYGDNLRKIISEVFASLGYKP